MLHDDFEMTTAPLVHFGNKDLKEIQRIVTSTEAANLAKQAVRARADLAMMAKNKQLEKYLAKLKTNEKYFNCGKKGHYARDCTRQTKGSLKSHWKKLNTLDERKIKPKPPPPSRPTTTMTSMPNRTQPAKLS